MDRSCPMGTIGALHNEVAGALMDLVTTQLLLDLFMDLVEEIRLLKII